MSEEIKINEIIASLDNINQELKNCQENSIANFNKDAISRAYTYVQMAINELDKTDY